MSLLQGSQNIPDATDELEVLFPETLSETPGVILAVVENTSADPVKLAINATVTESSSAGFTVGLSQTTNSANYKLVWYVSDPGTLVSFINEVAFKGRRVSDLNQQLTLSDEDYFPVVKAYPTPHTKRIKWGRLKGSLLASAVAFPDRFVPVEKPGNVISFTEWGIYGSPEAPLTGNLTEDLSDGVPWVEQWIFHSSASVPEVPAGWTAYGFQGYLVAPVVNLIKACYTGESVIYSIENLV